MKRAVAAIATILALSLILSGCGETHRQQATKTPTERPSSSLTTSNYHTLPNGLSGSCTGDATHPDNHLQSVNLSTSEGQLHITIHNADRMDLVEDGYYINIYSDKFEQTQIRLEKKHDGLHHVSIARMYGTDRISELEEFQVPEDREIKVSVPTSEIAGEHGVTWNAAKDRNGEDVAFCPPVKSDRVPLR
ncbi:hypothetical protein [Bifidobacterium asteroides]|uniref:hypothetical protein n=1 Tax=Bifidobacterium asteroides TaxID=1684 RepID=UPI0018DCB916|nr:hypothetical protein [Bifidobacterium asteroides]MBH9983797.1 hypothetical protein [Bifidobacterium asteroides]